MAGKIGYQYTRPRLMPIERVADKYHWPLRCHAGSYSVYFMYGYFTPTPFGLYVARGKLTPVPVSALATLSLS